MVLALKSWVLFRVTNHGDGYRTGVIFGTETNDGMNLAGNPKVMFCSLFYHVRDEADQKEYIIPETNVRRI